MKRKIKVNASFSGVLPIGEYANSRPGFMAEEEFEFDGDNSVVDDVIKTRQQELQAICFGNYEIEAEKARIAKITADLQKDVFHEIEGEKYARISWVSSYDKTFYVGDEDLKIYAAQGSIIDAEIRNFVRTGVYKDSSELIECTADRFILKNKKLSTGRILALAGWNFQGFLAKYPISDLKSIDRVYSSKKYKIAGSPDLVGKYDGLKTLVSIKRTEDEVSNFIQEAGYSLCDGFEDIEQFMVVEMKAEADGGNKQGFSKPAVTKEIARYRELFIRKRNDITKIYGV